MFEVRHETTVGAAHRLRVASGEGERLHGHNWRIVVFVRCSELDARGMVLDFADLGTAVRRFVEPYEHVLLNEVPPYEHVEPTAENVARVIADGLAAQIDNARVYVHRVEVWETDVCAATYFRRDPGR